ncbi:MAG: anti-sigma factor, partial [Actinobacteria bacterium]|nr:anti-sigma factor [Actinomycetota bacterium]
METTGHDRHADDLGAYLLGALPDAEAAALEGHLVACDRCREELEHLRPAADALPHSVEQYEAPPSLKGSLMAAVQDAAPAEGPAARPRSARRRRWLSALVPERPLTAAGIACAVLVAGAAAGFGMDRLTNGSPRTRTLTATVDRRAIPAAAARLEIPAHGYATLRASGLPVLHGGRVYEVWLEARGAVRPAGALFAATRAGGAAAAIPASLRGVERVLVTRERAGGSARPTEPPVISVRT